MEKKKLFLIVNQHMDLVWRRCFERDIQFGGRNFVPYADLEAFFILDNLKLCEKYPFYRFMIESVAVLEKFLQRYPQLEEQIAAYLREGRILMSFTGHNIVDANLITGESIIRNYRYGYHYLKDKFGVTPDGADRNDAFGNSAQLPQIIRGFGVKWIHHVAYTPCKAPYWRGLDGSTLFVAEPLQAGSIGGFAKFPPCPACGGHRDKPCPVCGDRRVDLAHMESRRFPLRFDEQAALESPVPGFIICGGEEVLPNEEIIRWAQDNADRFDAEFTGYESYAPYYSREIALTENPPAHLVQESPECNCNNTGVYVSRIGLKQKIRRLEHTIFAAETMAAMEWLRKKTYPAETFRQIWDKALFAMFHDAVTGTHVDAGYTELNDAIDEAQTLTEEILAAQAVFDGKRITVFNPCGIGLSGDCEVLLPEGLLVDAPILSAVPENGKARVRFRAQELPPYGSKVYDVIADDGRTVPRVLFAAEETQNTGDAVLNNTSVLTATKREESGSIVLENEYYRITASNGGIQEIFDKQHNRMAAIESEYKVGEWILELDIGSPWATESVDRRRIPLAPYTRIIRHEKTADRETVTFRITPDIRHGFTESSFEVEHSVTLLRGVDQVLFSADVRWDTQNHRLRIAFPTPLAGRHLYDIPYGMLERRPYEENIVLPDNAADWASACGDYPAIHWAGIDGREGSLALFNRGTPSYQINTDKHGVQNMFLSVLRSPTIPNCLQSSVDYIMTDYYGMMDNGRHRFEYALKAYDGALADSSVHADGVGYNARLVAAAAVDSVQLPRSLSAHTWISALLPSHDGEGLIVRAAEFRGTGGLLQISLPEGVTAVTETDLRELPKSEPAVENGYIVTEIKPFEIKTFHLKI